ncbi:oxalate oxidase GF-3.8 [Achaetomium macrosporum]|uniref:Oxalate oxidase GF-3.8 n=1 Tax=Achaetomium macrosporum TaxID=79813 RepID=A0AAN7CC01_9PEZI|nr:oxalate oxidase GF-3.8 [Achaetomium macrosporum]
MITDSAQMKPDPYNNNPKIPFGSPNRYTTTHDPTHKAIFFPPDSTTGPPPLPSYSAGGMVIHDAWTTHTTPLSFTSDADISLLTRHQSSPLSGVWFPSPGETLLRYCDWPPLSTIPLHRTETLDLGVCVAGEMELALDSGERRTLLPGDVIVQRGAMHAWRNPSATEWARVVFFLVGAEAVRVSGGVVMRGFLPWAGGGGERLGEKCEKERGR